MADLRPAAFVEKLGETDARDAPYGDDGNRPIADVQAYLIVGAVVGPVP